MKWETDPTKVWPSGNLVPMHGRKVRVHEKQKILFGGTTVPISLQNQHLNTAKLPLHGVAQRNSPTRAIPMHTFGSPSLVASEQRYERQWTQGTTYVHSMLWLQSTGQDLHYTPFKNLAKDWVDKKVSFEKTDVKGLVKGLNIY